MNHKTRNGKYIICKDGIYFALTSEQVTELQAVLMEIQTLIAKDVIQDKQLNGE